MARRRKMTMARLTWDVEEVDETQEHAAWNDISCDIESVRARPVRPDTNAGNHLQRDQAEESDSYLGLI